MSCPKAPEQQIHVRCMSELISNPEVSFMQIISKVMSEKSVKSTEYANKIQTVCNKF